MWLAVLGAAAFGGMQGYGIARERLASDFSPEVRRGFMDACTSDGTSTRSFCTCALEKADARYTQAEYLTISADMRAGQPAPRELVEDLSACGTPSAAG